MIIVRENTLSERKPTIKRPPPIRNPAGVVAAFDQIRATFLLIFAEYSRLNIIFISENWNLAESQKDSLASYSEHAEAIRIHLTNIEAINAGLTRFLAADERPIPIKENVPAVIDSYTEWIGTEIKRYYDEVKGTMFPRFDEEIKRHRSIIGRINSNINRINEINISHGGRSINYVKNLSI